MNELVEQTGQAIATTLDVPLQFDMERLAALEKLSEIAARTEMVPKQFKGRPDDVLVAFIMGDSVGLHPMQAVQNIAVINGQPSLYGDGMLAVCQQHPQWGGKIEHMEYDDAGIPYRAVCIVKRKGEPDTEQSFTLQEAEQAGLLKKQGPWQGYARRMLQWRARSWALRDAFADALRGFQCVEELAPMVEIEAEVQEIEPTASASDQLKSTMQAQQPKEPKPEPEPARRKPEDGEAEQAIFAVQSCTNRAELDEVMTGLADVEWPASVHSLLKRECRAKIESFDGVAD